MEQPNIYHTIETQLATLDEPEQKKVLSFIQSLHNQKLPEQKNNLRELEELIAIGSGTLYDGAAEHDHYIYGTPKHKK